MASAYSLGQASTSAKRLDSDVEAVRVPDVASLLDDEEEAQPAPPKSSQRHTSQAHTRTTRARSHSAEKSPRKKRVVEAPRTLVEHAQRKGYSSVSDLVSPAWCEYALNYNILGLSHLPLAERPLTIHTSTGAQIIRDVKIAIERDKVMDEGKVSSSNDDELDDVEKWELGVQKRREAIQARRKETRTKQYSSSPEKPSGSQKEARRLEDLRRSLAESRSSAVLLAPASNAGDAAHKAVFTRRAPSSSVPSSSAPSLLSAASNSALSASSLVFNPAYVPNRSGNKMTRQIERSPLKVQASALRYLQMRKGKRQHKILEREIHPVEVHVRTKTREDAWALRLLRLITGLRSLLDCGKVRELPVFGLIHGRLVLGVIDEISRVDMEKLNAPSSANTQSEPASSSAAPKRWVSQEEWKRQAMQKPSVPTKNKQPDKTQPTLAAFGIGKPSKPASNASATSASEAPPPPSQIDKGKAAERASVKLEDASARYGFVISDTKTRYSPTLPGVSSQRSARLQCMVYKRLLDGLLAPFVQNAAVLKEDASPHALALDPEATALDPQTLFAALDLDTQLRLSPAFTEDAAPLCDSYGVHLLRPMSTSKRAAANAAEGKRTDPSSEDEGAERQSQNRYSTNLLGRRFFQRTNSFEKAQAALAGKSPAPIDLTLEDVDEEAEEAAETVLSCTLEDVGHILVSTLRELLRAAAQGFGLEAAQPGLGAMHSELQLHYVSQVKGSMGRFNKRTERASGSSTAKQAKRGSGTQSQGSPRKSSQTQLNFASQKSRADSELDDTEDEEVQLQRAIQLSMQDQTPIAEAEERDEEGMILSQTVPLPPSSQQSVKEKVPLPPASQSVVASSSTKALKEAVVDLTLSSPSNTPQKSQPAEPVAPASPLAPKGKIIGIVRFTHLPQDLDAHLRSVLRMWTGVRPLRGVGRDNVWRCDGCEFKDGCEWRSDMARLDQERFRMRKKREEQKRLAAARLAKSNAAQKASKQRAEREEEEELMWSTVGEVEAEESQQAKPKPQALLPVVLEISSDEEVQVSSDGAVARTQMGQAKEVIVLEDEELWSQLDSIDQDDLGEGEW